jgi:hypothetical protein
MPPRYACFRHWERDIRPKTPENISNPVAKLKLKWAAIEFHAEGVVIPPAKPASNDGACQMRLRGPKRHMTTPAQSRVCPLVV